LYPQDFKVSLENCVCNYLWHTNNLLISSNNKIYFPDQCLARENRSLSYSHLFTILINKIAKFVHKFCIYAVTEKFYLILTGASCNDDFFQLQTFLKVFKRHQKENEALLKRYTKVSTY